jgi:cytochrome c oxidase subunit II
MASNCLEYPLRRPGRRVRQAGHEICLSDNVFGVDPADPNGKDDIQTLNEIHVPVGKPVIVYVSSKDVIHSFKMVAMRVCQDAIPGLRIPCWFTPTKMGATRSTARSSAARPLGMTGGFLTVESQADFDKWLASKVRRHCQF